MSSRMLPACPVRLSVGPSPASLIVTPESMPESEEGGLACKTVLIVAGETTMGLRCCRHSLLFAAPRHVQQSIDNVLVDPSRYWLQSHSETARSVT